MANTLDSFHTKSVLQLSDGSLNYFSLKKLKEDVDRFPFSIKVLLESLLRQEDGSLVTKEDVQKMLAWTPAGNDDVDVPFIPARVVLHSNPTKG